MPFAAPGRADAGPQGALTCSILVGLALLAVTAVPAAAQEVPARDSGRPFILEGSVGYLGFTDERLIDHLALAGSARTYLTRRLAIGAEVARLRGPGRDRDWRVAGLATIDLLTPGRGAARREVRSVTPYAIAGAGWMSSTLPTGAGLYTSGEFALTVGGGVRIAAPRDWHVAPEVRIGWEPHVQASVAIGRRW